MAFTKLNSDRKPVLSKVTASGIACAVQSTTFLLSMSYYCTRLQKQTQRKTLSSAVTPWVDVWHLVSPTFHNNCNYVLRLTHAIVFDLNNSIFSFKGWILTEEYHLQQGNCDSCTAHNCHEKPQPPMREQLLRFTHGENTQVEIMQARNKVKRLRTARKECYSRKMYK